MKGMIETSLIDIINNTLRSVKRRLLPQLKRCKSVDAFQI
jgi:hypothetical protein